MPPSTLKRLSGLAGIVAGVLFVVAELLNALVIPDTLSAAFDDLGQIAVTDGFFVQSLLTLLAGMLGLGKAFRREERQIRTPLGS